MMKTRYTLLSYTAALALPFGVASGQVLFQDDFNSDTSANWTVNKSIDDARSAAEFGFDYSTLGIPSASGDATTSGLRMRANMTVGELGHTFSGLSVSPTGQSFTGNYSLKFDVWMNYYGPLDALAAPTGNLSGGGILTAGTSAQWGTGSAAAIDSLIFGATGSGASGFADYRAYLGSVLNDTDISVYAAGNRDHADPYYSGFGGQGAPAAQLAAHPEQTGTVPVGAAGMAWRAVEIRYLDEEVSWFMDGLLIASADTSGMTLGGTNVFLTHWDFDSNPAAGNEELLFGLFDNVQVEVIPEPSTYAMIFGLVAGLAIFVHRRRKNRV